MDPIGIYLAADPPGVFLDVSPKEAARALEKAAIDLAPPGDAIIAPPAGTTAQRIGEIVLNPVQDDARYTVDRVTISDSDADVSPPSQPQVSGAKDHPEQSVEDAQRSAMSKLAVAVNEMIIKHGLVVVHHSGGTTITKADGTQEEEQFVMALVLEPNDGVDGPLKPDTQRDVYSAAEIRKAAHGWLEAGGAVDLQHNWKPFARSDVAPVETFIAPVDFTLGDGERAQKIIKGTWMLALHVINKELWSAVKAGKLGAYSIGGAAARTPVAEGELHG